MRNSITLYYLDAYNAGDPSLVQRLARLLLASDRGSILVADPSDALLLALQGLDAQGVAEIANDPQNGEKMRSTVTSFTRSLVVGLTDFQVPAVMLAGWRRGLARLSAQDHSLILGDWQWVEDLAVSGAVPIVSPMAKGPDGNARLVAPPDFAVAVASHLAANEVQVATFDDNVRRVLAASAPVAVIRAALPDR